jgi:hypothetical protein
MLLDGVEFDDACTTLTGQEPPGREKNASGTSAAKRETQTRQAAPQGRADAEREDAERAEREKREAAERTGHALELWHEAGPLNRLSLNYFASRGIPELPLPDVHGVLRLHPRRPFGSGERHPCIIALLRNTLSDAPQAIHRTALTREGRKLDRKAFGPKVGAAIKLWPDADVTTGLVIGEGLETVLAAATRIEYRHTLLRPAWAVVDAANLEKFTVLPGVDALTILVDHDEIGRGQEASRACAHEWTATGREVILLTPRKLGSDFNDVVAS